MYSFKFIYKCIVAIALTHGFCLAAKAQDMSQLLMVDSTVVSETDYDRMFRLMSDDKEMIHTLYKVNAVDWGQLKPSIIIETKLYKSISIKPYGRLSEITWNMSDGFHYAIESGVNLNFYHNLKQRSKSGKDCNGFSGNYFSVGVHFFNSDYPKYTELFLDRQNINSALSLDKSDYMIYSYIAGYGIQRRFANIGYFDFQAGVAHSNFVTQSKTSVAPYLSIEIGFGLTARKIKAWIE